MNCKIQKAKAVIFVMLLFPLIHGTIAFPRSSHAASPGARPAVPVDTHLGHVGRDRGCYACELLIYFTLNKQRPVACHKISYDIARVIFVIPSAADGHRFIGMVDKQL